MNCDQAPGGLAIVTVRQFIHAEGVVLLFANGINLDQWQLIHFSKGADDAIVDHHEPNAVGGSKVS